MMERRTFLAMVPVSLLAAPLAAEAQQAGRIWRIGLLDYGSPDPARLAGGGPFRTDCANWDTWKGGMSCFGRDGETGR
jgi:hypothetical protein